MSFGRDISDLLSPLGEARELIENARTIGGDFSQIAAQVGAHLQIFLYTHVRKDMAAFRTMGDAALQNLRRRAKCDVFALEDDAAPRGLEQPRQRAQHRALPGAVGPDEGDDLAFLNGKRHAFQCSDAAVAAFEVADFKHAPPAWRRRVRDKRG
jgi:hypothetical protein